MKNNNVYIVGFIAIFLAMVVFGIVFKIQKNDLYSKRRQFFCEYLVLGMEKEQVREKLASNGIYANESVYGSGETWWLYSSQPNFERLTRDVGLQFRESKYTGAAFRVGFEQSEALCSVDDV
jgi:hypothetical protein